MNPGSAKIVSCPFCGAKKELMTLISGNTASAEIWSDYKMIAPMFPQVSPVQKCPSCGKYYYEHKQPYKYGGECSFEKGEMSYQEWKEAYYQFLEGEDLASKELIMMKIWLIQAYNDCYSRYELVEVDPLEEGFIIGIIKELIECSDGIDELNPIVIAELYREAGDMQKCAEVLSGINPEDLKGYSALAYDGIKERMAVGDKRVFKLQS